MGASAVEEMAARMARIATTTISSINVIPRAGGVRMLAPISARSVHDHFARPFGPLHGWTEKFARAASHKMRSSPLWAVDLPAGLEELLRLLRHPFLGLGVVPDVLGDLHGAELRPAHGAEVRRLGPLGRQG